MFHLEVILLDVYTYNILIIHELLKKIKNLIQNRKNLQIIPKFNDLKTQLRLKTILTFFFITFC